MVDCFTLPGLVGVDVILATQQQRLEIIFAHIIQTYMNFHMAGCLSVFIHIGEFNAMLSNHGYFMLLLAKKCILLTKALVGLIVCSSHSIFLVQQDKLMSHGFDKQL